MRIPVNNKNLELIFFYQKVKQRLKKKKAMAHDIFLFHLIFLINSLAILLELS